MTDVAWIDVFAFSKYCPQRFEAIQSVAQCKLQAKDCGFWISTIEVSCLEWKGGVVEC